MIVSIFDFDLTEKFLNGQNSVKRGKNHIHTRSFFYFTKIRENNTFTHSQYRCTISFDFTKNY